MILTLAISCQESHSNSFKVKKKTKENLTTTTIHRNIAMNLKTNQWAQQNPKPLPLNKTASLNWQKPFAHPARVAIVQHLLKTNSCVCGDIVDALPLSQSTVSQHLKELKKAGIITGNVEPPKVLLLYQSDNVGRG